MVGSRSWPIPVRKGRGAAEGAGQLQVVARMELESPTAILDGAREPAIPDGRPLSWPHPEPSEHGPAGTEPGLRGGAGSWRLVVVIVAGATEFLDGVLRRLWHVSGAMGRLLDLITDKVFVLIKG